ncbi:hypothetical protein [Rhizobium sp. SYY.PMSO]|uniref:hypothetical protein n=1 Tax=Rhizobium sp. SYY.PMSO TaxID=3382192 RepID=UPI00398F9E64
MADDALIRFVTRQDYEQWLILWEGYNSKGDARLRQDGRALRIRRVSQVTLR